ncbi:MAG: hypothetical protein KY410_05310 [Proteobacteria bacterium]|nr:hypothetical protein [Pseudomonadota bacterium]
MFSINGEAGDRFGAEVAVDGDAVAIAAPFESVNGIREAGVVYVYTRDAQGAWREVDRLAADDPTTMARFGSAVAIDGERMIVSAPRADEELGESIGAAYVFDYDADTDAWQPSAKIKRDMTNLFATSVDVAGDRIATTATGDVFIYEFDGENWNLVQAIQASAFDVTVRLEDDVLVVADPEATVPDIQGAAAGHVQVFEPVGSEWGRVATLSSPTPMQSDRFGQDMDFNGGMLAVANGPGFPDHVSLFMKNESGEWTRVLERDSDNDFPQLDRSLAVSPDTLVTGGPQPFGGFITIFDVSDVLDDAGGGTGGGIATDDNTNTGGDGFGSAVDTGSGFTSDADDDFGSDLDVDSGVTTGMDEDFGSDIDVDSGLDSRLDAEIDNDFGSEDEPGGLENVGEDDSSGASLNFDNRLTSDDPDDGGGAFVWLLALLPLFGRRRWRNA